MDIVRIQAFLDQPFLGNQVGDFIWFGCIILAGLLLKRFVSVLLSKLFYRFVKDKEESVPFTVFVQLLRTPFETLTLLIVLYLAFDRFDFPLAWELAPIEKFGLRMMLERSFQMVMILSITWILLRLCDFFAAVFTIKAQQTESPLDDQLVPFFKELIKVIVIIFSIFFIMGTVFKLNVASLIAGLGIGGLAVALAAKESLENLFASFTIFLDRPFVAGDVVQVGAISGTVEKVGFRSTRIRTLEKSFLTVPNKMMIDQALDNLTQRRFRRARFLIGLPYDTPSEKIKKIISDITKVINQHALTKNEPGAVKLHELASSSINLLIVFFVETADWTEYATVKEEINYRIIDIFQHHNVSFAFPTSIVNLRGQKAFENDNTNSELLS